MLLAALALQLLITIISARIYKVQISVNDDYEWRKYNNASVYFVLTTNLNGDIKTSPAYIVQDGLPGTGTYTYSFLLDDIGEPETFRIYHSDSNKLCINWISLDTKNATRRYQCTSDTYFECQEIEAYFDSQRILHAPDVFGCKWQTIVSHTLMKEYNIQITMDSSYSEQFYNKIGLALEGFVFDSYFTPYYHLASHTNEIYTNAFVTYDKVVIHMVTYDVTPLQSIWIGTQNMDDLCVNSIVISVTNDPIMNVSKTFNDAQCVSYSQNDQLSPNGCALLSFDFRADKSLVQTQSECDIAQTSFEYNNEQRSTTTQYTLTMNVSKGTKDYIFYQMEGHTGDRTECFYTTAYQLPMGLSMHKYSTMKNIGNPKKLYILHDRQDDICISYIGIHNKRTNDTIVHEEVMCSEFLYDETEPGRCNVITINFETSQVSNVVSINCPFSSLCEFGLYESVISARWSVSSIVILIIFILLLLFILLSCIYCDSVYSCLIHCWDPFVNECWNPRFEEKCCRCSNTTDMQHNLCCYCFGCDYCNPFSIHRRRTDKKSKNKTVIDEYDTDDGDTMKLRGTADTYDMGDIDLGGNGHLKQGLKTKYSSPSLSLTDEEEDELGDFGDTFDDSDSAQLVKKLHIEDAPINRRMDDDDEDERLKSGVVDEYDD